MKNSSILPYCKPQCLPQCQIGQPDRKIFSSCSRLPAKHFSGHPSSISAYQVPCADAVVLIQIIVLSLLFLTCGIYLILNSFVDV